MANSFDEVVKNRKSVRKFNEEEVTRDELQQIVDAGTLAPSGMHMNELYFLGLDKQTASKYLEISKAELGMDRYYGASYVILVLRDLSKKSLYELDCGAAMENMLLKATDLGLQSCWVHATIDLWKKESIRNLLSELGYESDKFELIESIAIGHGAAPKANEVDSKRAKVI